MPGCNILTQTCKALTQPCKGLILTRKRGNDRIQQEIELKYNQIKLDVKQIIAD